jgi:hypothetical protein
MKCYHILFTKKGIKNNIGVFIIIPIILIHIASILFFYIKGYKILKNIVDKIVNSKINLLDKDKSKSEFNSRKSVNLKSINLLKDSEDKNVKRRKSKEIKSKVFKNKLNEIKDKFWQKDEKDKKSKEKYEKNNNYNAKETDKGKEKELP